MIELDSWQKEILNTEGNIALRSGRQVGKSTIVSIKAAQYALTHKNKTILVIASVERQAQLLFEKILATVYEMDSKQICKGKDKPTKHKLKLKNKSSIHCLPTGLSGYGIRGYTVDLLIADEAAFIPEDVWVAVSPMLAATGGNMILLSTPFGKGGFFYDCFTDPTFTTFHISSEDCTRISEEYLIHQRERMSRLQYAQEFLGEFLDELRQLFSLHLIESCTDIIEWNWQKEYNPLKYSYFLGVDVARFGADESAFVIVEMRDKENLRCIHVETSEKTSTVETIGRIVALDEKWGFNKILIDDGGIGGAVLDKLLVTPNIKRKVIGLNNAKKSIDRDGDIERRKKLVKEELYTNLLKLMEYNHIHLIKDPKLKWSLMSIQFEYSDDGKLRIFGKYSHIVEGLIRAAWGEKTKGLNIFARSF